MKTALGPLSRGDGHHYGFSITACPIDMKGRGVFISGLSWERGMFRQILPIKHVFLMKPGEPFDFVPVWSTEQEVMAVIEWFKASPAGEQFTFQAADIRSNMESGG